MINATNYNLDLIEVLEGHKIFYHTKGTDKKFFKNSDVYKRYGTYISLSEIEAQPNDNNHFMELTYNKALAHIAKSSINVEKEIENNHDYYKVFNSEINSGKLLLCQYHALCFRIFKRELWY